MSQGSLFWANARGKLGESVYYRAGGEQRNRTYVKNIKNPRTLAQAKNRITLMNYVAGFRSLRPILANSFVSRKSSQSGFNAFVSANKNPNSPAVDKYAAENLGYSVLGDAVVSKGNLIFESSHQCFDIPIEEGSGDTPQSSIIGYRMAVVPGSLYDPETEEATELLSSLAGLTPLTENVVIIMSNTQVRALYKALGLPSDAVINVIHGRYKDEGYKYTTAKFTIESQTMITPDFSLAVSTGATESFQSGTFSSLLFGVSAAQPSGDEDYFAVIVSYKVNGTMDVSNARLTTDGRNTEYTDQFRPNGFVYEQILAEYSPSQGSALSV